MKKEIRGPSYEELEKIKALEYKPLDPITELQLKRVELCKEKFISKLKPEGSIKRAGFIREKMSGEFTDNPQPFSYKIGKGPEASVTVDAVHGGKEYPKDIIPRMRGDFSFDFENPDKTDIRGDERTDEIVEKAAQKSNCNALIIETNRLAVDFNRYPKEGSPYRARDAYNFVASEYSRKKAENFILSYRDKIKELVDLSKSKRHLHLAIHGIVDRKLEGDKPLDMVVGTIEGHLCDSDIEAWLYANLKDKLSKKLGRKVNIGLSSINKTTKEGSPRDYPQLQKELKKYGIEYKQLEGQTEKSHIPLRFFGVLPQIVHRLAYPHVSTVQLEMSATLREQYQNEVSDTLAEIVTEFAQRFGFKEKKPEIKETAPLALKLEEAPKESLENLSQELKGEMIPSLIKEARIRSLCKKMIGVPKRVREQFGFKEGQRVIVQIKDSDVETDSIIYKGAKDWIRIPALLRKQMELPKEAVGRRCDLEIGKVRWVPKIILDIKDEGSLTISKGSNKAIRDLKQELTIREKKRMADSLARRMIGLSEKEQKQFNISPKEQIITENRITGKKAIATIYKGREKCVQMAETLRKELGIEDEMMGSKLRIHLPEKDGERRIVIEKKET